MTSPDLELGVSEVRMLRAAGLVPAHRYLSAIDAVRDEAFWARWGRHALLALGAGQFLAGLIFFFAYNWNDLSSIAKFAIVESALAIALAGALLVGLNRGFGQVLLIAASVLTGVLLAVIGQVYQTGADAYELFVAWVVLILPWAVISRNAVHWLLWLIVAETALALYSLQALTVVGDVTNGDVWVLVGTTIVAALATREVAVKKGLDWLSAHWTRLILITVGLAVLFAPAAAHLIDIEDLGSGPLSIAAFLLVTLGAGWVYWRFKPDFAALVIVIGFADAFFVCVGYRVIDDVIGFDFDEVVPALSSFGAMILWAIVGTGSAGFAMRRLHGTLRGGLA